MPTKYHLTEPFPAPTQKYAFTGRGGAGNITRSRPATKVAVPAHKDLYLVQSAEPYPPPSSLHSGRTVTRKLYTSGRGGIGNLHPAAERAMFSFDEELEQARKLEASMAPIYHIGRGGEGNVCHTKRPSSGSVSTRSGSTSSSGSEGALRSSLEKVKNRFSKSSN